jgi:hypothetical protein
LKTMPRIFRETKSENCGNVRGLERIDSSIVTAIDSLALPVYAKLGERKPHTSDDIFHGSRK